MYKKLKISLILYIFSVFLLACSCKNDNKESRTEPLYIAISHSVPKYVDWLKTGNPDIVAVDFYYLSKDSIDLIFDKCQALLITGGNDIYPGRYDMELDTFKCEEPDLRRDTLEFYLFEKAMAQQKPVFGICRGLQLINVALGGTLYTDLPSDIGTKVIHRLPDDKECYHNVLLSKNTLLYEAAGNVSVKVNSYHHQGIKNLAPGLTALAVADDYLIEAIQWTDTVKNNTFIAGVQFHPEMFPKDDKFSKGIARAFIHAIEKKYSKTR